MRKPSLIILLAGLFMLVFAVYVFYLLDFDSPAVLIAVGIIVLLYLQNSDQFK